MSVTLAVTFSEHMSFAEIPSLVSGIAAYGNILPAESPRTFSVEVFRTSKLPKLKLQLADWETRGWLRWGVTAPSSN